MRYARKIFLTMLSMVLIFSAGVSAAEVYKCYTVQNGDSVYKIAHKFGADQSAIINANALSHGGTMIYPGM